MSISNFYKKLPKPLKNALKHAYGCLPLSVRLGRNFFKEKNRIYALQWASKAELENYQDQRLRALIRHACDHVPYYRKVFKDRGLCADDIRQVSDLKKLPILTKDDVRNNLKDLVAQNLKPNELLKLSTSGTTGQPLTIYYEKKKDYFCHDPYIWRFFEWGGHRLGQKRATLSAWTFKDEQKVYKFNPALNLLILSAYDLNLQNAKAYAAALEQYKIKFIDGYPSCLDLLVRFFRKNAIRPNVNIKSIFCRSEFLHDWQRANIESFFKCKCFDWYGMEERAVLGCECEKHEGMHLCGDYAITEFIGEAPRQQIITTSLTNFAMPLIRYGTGDVGHLSEKSCSCGRVFPLFILEGGRQRNFAIAKDGSSIPVVNIDIPGATDHIHEFQFVQYEPGKLVLNIVRMPDFSSADEEKIHRVLQRKFANNMDIALEYVNAIERKQSRKTAIFIQKMTTQNKLIANG